VRWTESVLKRQYLLRR